MRETSEEIREQIRERFTRVARSAENERKFPVGPKSAKALGYEPEDIDGLPVEATESFSGVGNPLSLQGLDAGQTVLDLGCGAGLDSFLAARRVGPSGRVIGVDMTRAMVEKARKNAAAIGLTNIELHQGEIEALPVQQDSVDVVISNGVLNLCPDKRNVLIEVFRVLRPGGRFLMADILLHDDVTREEVAQKGEWSD